MTGDTIEAGGLPPGVGRLSDMDSTDRGVSVPSSQPLAGAPSDGTRLAEWARNGCSCGLAVGRWTGHESRALREALRMSIRAFAEHLGVSKATVSGWENRNPMPLRLATQEVLDQALALADAEAKTRFALLLRDLPGHPCEAGTGAAGGATVTASHRPERTRTAS